MPLPQKYIRKEHFWLEPSYAKWGPNSKRNFALDLTLVIGEFLTSYPFTVFILKSYCKF